MLKRCTLSGNVRVFGVSRKGNLINLREGSPYIRGGSVGLLMTAGACWGVQEIYKRGGRPREPSRDG